MDHVTIRLMLPREAVLGLLEEPEFQDCIALVAQRDVKPVPDVYMPVFVVQIEPMPEWGLRLSPVSTTVVGITRTSSKRLVGEGLYWADTKPECPAMGLLRAHYRAEESFVNKAVNDIGTGFPIGGITTVTARVISTPCQKSSSKIGPSRRWNASSARI